MFSKATTILALAASATAHMILNNPVPFGKSTLNNSPLEPKDFPCKQRSGVYAITQMNQWDAGTTQVISFQGSAVHGGGSCQFSITTDPEPTVNSQWKVIQSVVGGCPSSEEGNLDTPDPNPKNPNDRNKPTGPDTVGDSRQATFPVTMPKNIPDGRYTFAWTWINRVGNREFYMNCAPIQVGSGTNQASTASVAQALSSLPDMFVANLPNEECATTASQDFSYPDPGQFVIQGKLAKPGNTLTGAGCAKQTKMGAGNGQIGSPSPGTPSKPSGAPQASEKPASSPPAYQAPQPSKVPSNPGGGLFAPGASSAPAARPTAQPAPPAAKPTPAEPAPSGKPQTPQTPPPKDNPNSTTPANGDCTPCTNDGAVVCIGTKQFGLCNRGCAVAQDLAAGMACANGVVVAATKRHLHFPRGHLHRRFSAAHLL